MLYILRHPESVVKLLLTGAGRDDGDSLFNRYGGHCDGPLFLISEELAGQMLEKNSLHLEPLEGNSMTST